MMIAIALAVLASPPAVQPPPIEAPRVVVEHAGPVQTARAEIRREDGRVLMRCHLHAGWPPIAARRAVTLEAIDAGGKVLFTRSGVARREPATLRHKRGFDAELSLPLPDLSGVAVLRVRAGS